MDIRGQHCLLDIIFNTFPGDDQIKFAIEIAFIKNDIKVVEYVEHQFTPQGKTCVWILSASHFSFHSFPEANYASCDCYTCSNEGSAMGVVTTIIEIFKDNISKVYTNKLVRGDLG